MRQTSEILNFINFYFNLGGFFDLYQISFFNNKFNYKKGELNFF
jgi:hypothetical protein